jgi:hypothetical protein
LDESEKEKLLQYLENLNINSENIEIERGVFQTQEYKYHIIKFKEKHFELFFDTTECSQKELLEIYNICSLYNCKVVIHYIINNQ